MKTFLEYVAKDILDKYGNDLTHVAVVFPNKRAALFLNQALAKEAGHPIWSPAYITISELFRNHSKLKIADSIQAICELYKCYQDITGTEETLDTFYGWGQLLLADFDDIDKNMADSKLVFRNLRDWHEFDDLSFLSKEQKETIRQFFSNFNDPESELQNRFLRLWSKLLDIYDTYKKHLRSKGIAYEGMLYKDVVENKDIDFKYDTYLFVGFNVLQKVEQQLFTRLMKEGRAHFYWDYDRYYMERNNGGMLNEGGVYLRQYLDKFPNELPNDNDNIYNNLRKKKKITYVSAPTDDIQARYITEWLRDGNKWEAGKRTAIVLCDERLLQTVIHCIPNEKGMKLNVTTGYPLQQTPIAALVGRLMAFRHDGYSHRHHAFHLHYLNTILRHSYARYITPAITEILEKINITQRQYYITQDDFKEDEGMSLLLASDTIERNRKKDKGLYRENNLSLLQWLRTIVKRVAVNGDNNEDALFQESLYRMYQVINRIYDMVDAGILIVNTSTLTRLIQQIINTTTIPFHGEPAEGIQIMGVLETRNLDFDHMLVLSCNEGNMPKGVDDNSFIPHSLRKAYGLTTIDNKIAIYSYYFHRMLQRAGDVTLCYNSSTEGLSTGEKSRFMLQLMVELDTPKHLLSLQAGQEPRHTEAISVVKDNTIISILNSITKIYPTDLNTYLRCQLRFYYKKILGIREPDDNDQDDVDNRIFGNIFHRAAELVYNNILNKDIISADDIDRTLNTEKGQQQIKDTISQAMAEELFRLPKGTIKHPELNGLQLINQEVIERYLRQMLETDRRQAPFHIIGHELYAEMPIELANGRQIIIGGRIDRLEELYPLTNQPQLSVVDYKTGRKKAEDFSSIDELFTDKGITNLHADYIIQAMLYSLMVQTNSETYNPHHIKTSPALLFIQHASKEKYNSVLTMNGKPIDDVASLEEKGKFLNAIKEKLLEIFNPQQPFEPTQTKTFCLNCPYRKLCGR